MPDKKAPKKQPAPEADAVETAAEVETEEITADAAAELTDARREAADNWDKFARAQAELDNVKKRAQRDIEHARKFALEGFAKELLEVRDSLEMGLQHTEDETIEAQTPAARLREGGELTLRKLRQVMEKFHITQVDPKGEPFDPALHEAMSMAASDEVAPNCVLMVVQKGYRLHERLIRPARVVVAQAPATEDKTT